MELSIKQQQARDFIYGQILVVACPGSGKTTTIIDRAVKMVEEENIDSSTMLNITFTKAAAEEMDTRFRKKSAKRVSFSTIHAFCYKILCKEYGYTKDDILKESDKWIFVSDLLRNAVAPTQMEETVKEVVQGISFCKNKQLPPVAYRCERCDQNAFQNIYESYAQYTAKLKKIDFDDMLIVFRDKLITDSALLKKIREQYKFVTVDEFQDVNQIQADICYLIAGDNGNIYVVGDDDQSIYRFRGAESQIMLDFPKKYPACKKVFLDTNYRSGSDIVKIAGDLIENNTVRFDKKFLAGRKETGDVFLIESQNSIAQGENIAEAINALKNDGCAYEDMAVLFRNNSLATGIVSSFIKEKIPFRLTEKVSSIHNDSIFFDIKSYYNLATNQEQKGDLVRIANRPARYLPIRKLMNVTCDRDDVLKALAGEKQFVKNKATDMLWDIKALGEKKKPSLFVNYLITCMEYKEFLKKNAEYTGRDASESLDVLEQLYQEAKKFSSMPDWFSYAEKYEESLRRAAKRDNKKGVCLSTFHSAKGLEWKNVFVTSINEKVTPYIKAETPDDMEEERRMFYVAVTRAKDGLFLSYVKSSDGKQIPSRYLYEMHLFDDNLPGGQDNMQMDPDKGLG